MKFELPWRRRSGARRMPPGRSGVSRPRASRPAGAKPGSRGPAARPARPAGTRPFSLGRFSTIRIRPARARNGTARRGPRRIFSATRAAALLGLLGSLALGYGAVTSSAFELSATELPSLRWTAPGSLAAAIEVRPGANVFRIATAPIESRLRALPAVASAHVRVALPDRLVVEIAERAPILAWRVNETLFLVDREGHLFALGTADVVAAAKLPIVTDTRPASSNLAVGTVLSAVDLDAATRLASLVPKDVGSAATSLAVTVSDENGFVVRAPDAWTAIFGFYTPTRRTPDLIPGQVRLLRSLLAGREGAVAQVILADDRNGTYVPKPTP